MRGKRFCACTVVLNVGGVPRNGRAEGVEGGGHGTRYILFEDVQSRALGHTTISESGDRTAACWTGGWLLISDGRGFGRKETSHGIDFIVVVHVAVSVECFHCEDVSTGKSDKTIADVGRSKVDLAKTTLKNEVDNVLLPLVR